MKKAHSVECTLFHYFTFKFLSKQFFYISFGKEINSHTLSVTLRKRRRNRQKAMMPVKYRTATAAAATSQNNTDNMITAFANVF